MYILHATVVFHVLFLQILLNQPGTLVKRQLSQPARLVGHDGSCSQLGDCCASPCFGMIFRHHSLLESLLTIGIPVKLLTHL